MKLLLLLYAYNIVQILGFLQKTVVHDTNAQAILSKKNANSRSSFQVSTRSEPTSEVKEVAIDMQVISPSEAVGINIESENTIPMREESGPNRPSVDAEDNEHGARLSVLGSSLPSKRSLRAD